MNTMLAGYFSRATDTFLHRWIVAAAAIPKATSCLSCIDGYDAVEWLARQPWSNGKVGMWGGSYGGYNQWATLSEFPPHLATIVPASSAYPGKNMPMVNNIHIHMEYGDAGTTAKHYLVIGPWDHGGTRTAHRDVGGWTFGPADVIDINKLNKDWYDWTLKGGLRPEFLKNRVTYYLGGAEEWKYVSTLSHDSASRGTAYYLHRARKDSLAGMMDNKMAPPNEEPDRYTYDPMDVRPVELEHNGANLGWRPHHYLSVTRPILPLNPSPNGLVHETAPIEERFGNLRVPQADCLDLA
jgi:predicted acyl esterase